MVDVYIYHKVSNIYLPIPELDLDNSEYNLSEIQNTLHPCHTFQEKHLRVSLIYLKDYDNCINKYLF